MYPGVLADYSPYQVDATFTYTALGNILTVTSPGPNSALNNGVAQGTVTTTFGYETDTFSAEYSDNTLLRVNEALGEPITVTSPFGDNATRTQHYRYDALGNLALSISDTGNLRSDYLYNIANQSKYTIAPALTQPNMATRVVAAVNYAYPGGPAQSVAYYGDPVSANSPLPAPLEQAQYLLRQVTTEYGAAQEVKSVTGSTAPVGLAYDNAYQMTGLSDGKQHTSHFQYDGGGNRIKHIWPGG